jgi:predicted transcriptional regulator
MSPGDLDAVFHALAHPLRRELVDRLVEQPGANLRTLSAGFEVSRIAILKHLKVLQAARLVLSRKHGRERRHFFNAIPLQQVITRWTDDYASFWAGRMADVKQRVESRTNPGSNRKAAHSA